MKHIKFVPAINLLLVFALFSCGGGGGGSQESKKDRYIKATDEFMNGLETICKKLDVKEKSLTDQPKEWKEEGKPAIAGMTEAQFELGLPMMKSSTKELNKVVSIVEGLVSKENAKEISTLVRNYINAIKAL